MEQAKNFESKGYFANDQLNESSNTDIKVHSRGSSIMNAKEELRLPPSSRPSSITHAGNSSGFTNTRYNSVTRQPPPGYVPIEEPHSRQRIGPIKSQSISAFNHPLPQSPEFVSSNTSPQRPSQTAEASLDHANTKPLRRKSPIYRAGSNLESDQGRIYSDLNSETLQRDGRKEYVMDLPRNSDDYAGDGNIQSFRVYKSQPDEKPLESTSEFPNELIDFQKLQDMSFGNEDELKELIRDKFSSIVTLIMDKSSQIDDLNRHLRQKEKELVNANEMLEERETVAKDFEGRLSEIKEFVQQQQDEISSMKGQLDQAYDDLMNERAKCNSLQSNLDNIQERAYMEKDQSRQEFDNMMMRRETEYEDERVRLVEQLNSQETQIRELEVAHDTQRDHYATMRQNELDQLKYEYQRLIQQKNEEISKYKQMNSTYKDTEEKQTAEIDKLQRANQTSEQTLREHIDSLKNLVKVKENSITTLQNEVALLKNDNEKHDMDIKARNKDLESEVEALKDKMNLDKASMMQTIEEVQMDSNAEIQEMQEAAEDEINQLKIELAHLQSNTAAEKVALVEARDKAEAQLRVLREEHDQRQERYESTQEQLNKMRTQFEIGKVKQQHAESDLIKLQQQVELQKLNESSSTPLMKVAVERERDRRAQLEGQLQDMTTEVRKLSSIKKQQEKKIIGLQSKLTQKSIDLSLLPMAANSHNGQASQRSLSKPPGHAGYSQDNLLGLDETCQEEGLAFENSKLKSIIHNLRRELDQLSSQVEALSTTGYTDHEGSQDIPSLRQENLKLRSQLNTLKKQKHHAENSPSKYDSFTHNLNMVNKSTSSKFSQYHHDQILHLRGEVLEKNKAIYELQSTLRARDVQLCRVKEERDKLLDISSQLKKEVKRAMSEGQEGLPLQQTFANIENMPKPGSRVTTHETVTSEDMPKSSKHFTRLNQLEDGVQDLFKEFKTVIQSKPGRNENTNPHQFNSRNLSVNNNSSRQAQSYREGGSGVRSNKSSKLLKKFDRLKNDIRRNDQKQQLSHRY